MNKLYLWIGVALLAIGSFGATATYAFEGNAVVGFVQFLITKGLIPANKAQQALTLAEKLDTLATTSSASKDANKNNAHQASQKPIITEVSQLLEFSQRTYKQGVDVKGLLFIVTNPDNTARELEARRRCQVSYRIFDANNTMLFDSATVGECLLGERVTYFLPPNGSRMFEIMHKDSLYHLNPGQYRFELVYPEYGSGDLLVTITK